MVSVLGARRRDLHAQAERWVTSQQLRHYLDAVERAATERGEPGAPDREQPQWLAWARRYADQLDPLKASEPPRGMEARESAAPLGESPWDALAEGP